MARVCFDIDAIIFDSVSVAEEKFITATHKPTGTVVELDNQTALWGDWRKKNGGWIALQNELNGEEIYKAEDFEVVPGQRPRPFRVSTKNDDGDMVTSFLSPFDGAKKIVDDQIAEIVRKLGADSYFGFTGKGEVFRHDVATLLPYKGQRDDMMRPLLLTEMKDYVCKAHNITLVSGIEADDACSIATVKGYKEWKANGQDDAYKVIQVAVDKDTKQTEGWHFNHKKDKEPRLIQGFGSLWLNEKGDPDGAGRLWLYWQIAHGDDTDNYKANCFSKAKYGGKSAYKDLVDCKTDKEAWMKLVEIFKKLYPEPIEVEGCKGRITIDWLHVLGEMATMAMMLRHDGDKIVVKDVLDKLGIDYV